MKPLTERDIRASFVNCSKGDAKRLNLPQNFAELPWDDLDFLGWQEPGAPERAYLVAERDGGLIGVALRSASGQARSSVARCMCSLCFTTHDGGGVGLLTARRTGEAGRQGNSVGQYLCVDLACSLYLRGLKQPTGNANFGDGLSQEDKVARALANLDAFLDKITQ